ncbi:MAG TPA: hypothetical protein VFE13_07155 [Caulobacteraceae bacterium]|nr:hypothetical protein [Caulobacteraceae bacterium]
MSDEFDLSGVWQGLYSYPAWRRREPISFTARLVEMDGWIDGTTEETGAVGTATGKPLRAIIQGRRTGRSITFLKLYDGGHRQYDSVRYEGEIRCEGAEVEGVWSIPGNSDGSFLMIRSSGLDAAVEREAYEEV